MKVTIEFDGRSLLRWLLVILFVWAAVSKLANLQGFLCQAGGFLPAALASKWAWWLVAAITLPWLELFCGLMLLTGFWFQTGLRWVVVLSAIFVVCTAQAWMRGLHISCRMLEPGFLGPGRPCKDRAGIGLVCIFSRAASPRGGLWIMRGADLALRRASADAENPKN